MMGADFQDLFKFVDPKALRALVDVSHKGPPQQAEIDFYRG